MLYIHHISCISPQQTFAAVDIDRLQEVVDNKFRAIEPSYERIPSGILRRMGKAVRLGVGNALALLQNHTGTINGIIIGTANGGMEDCIKFLNQVMEYDEGMLTPTNFVQSTTNAIAAQIGLLTENKAYNSTHVHRGLAFENALLDAGMMLAENKDDHYLLGGIDEISTYNYNIDYLGGWYKKEPLLAKNLYQSASNGSLAGEGAAMFVVNGHKENAVARVVAIQMLHTTDIAVTTAQLQAFLQKNLPPGKTVDVMLSGENGDARLSVYYEACEKIAGAGVTIARFKHMSGEYPTVSAMALWLSCYILKEQYLPQHMIKYDQQNVIFHYILICNNYRGRQHSFILVEKTG